MQKRGKKEKDENDLAHNFFVNEFRKEDKKGPFSVVDLKDVSTRDGIPV